jgi:hypothetical protein
MQIDTAENVIALLIPVIAENFNSLETLNLLARTSNTLRRSVSGDMRLASLVVKQMPQMLKTTLRQLFVLPPKCDIPFAAIQDKKPLYPWSRVVLCCNVSTAFAIAMRTHTDIPTMAAAFNRRQVRSDAMKRAWHRRNGRAEEARQQRRVDITQIRADLSIVPGRHLMTVGQMNYTIYGIVKPMNAVYRDKRLMAIHTARGVITQEDQQFIDVAQKDKTGTAAALSHTERLLVLKCNIAWEHYLQNYSNHRELSMTVMRFDNAHTHPIEFLFPLPLIWPWVNQDPVYAIGNFQINLVPTMWTNWREKHDALYQVMNID